MDTDPLNQSGTPMSQSPLHPDQRGGEQEAVQRALNPDAATSGASADVMARDPVCGKLVDTRTASNTLASPVNEPMGTLYFDSPECKALFEEDPQKYGYNF